MLFTYTPYAVVEACDKALDDLDRTKLDIECISDIREMIINLKTKPSSISLEWYELDLIKEYL